MLIIYGMYHFLSAVTQTLTLSVTDTSTRTYQWGLTRDVIIVTSLIRDLSDVPSVSVLERFYCTYSLTYSGAPPAREARARGRSPISKEMW